MEGHNVCMHLDTGGALATSTRPIPSPGFGQVLVRVEAVLLTSDGLRPRGWHRSSGDEAGEQGMEDEEGGQVVPGSDFCGIIIDIGPGIEVEGLRFHEKVVVEGRSHCGTCFYCERGQTNLCTSGKLFGCDADGGCQQYIAVDHRLVHSFSFDLPFRQAVLTAAVAGVSHGMTKASIFPGDSVVVIGSCLKALLGVTFAKCLGADFVCVVGRPGDSEANSRRCGASLFMTLDDEAGEDGEAAGQRVRDAVLEQTEGRGADVVFFPQGNDGGGGGGRRAGCTGGGGGGTTAGAGGAGGGGRGGMRGGMGLALACVRGGGCVVTASPWMPHSSDTARSRSSEAAEPRQSGGGEREGGGEGRWAGEWREAMVAAFQREIRIVSAVGASSALFEQALRWIEGRLLDLGPLLTHVVPLLVGLVPDAVPPLDAFDAVIIRPQSR